MTSTDAAAPDPVVLAYPFRGRWMARNSPARRIPSHGTHLFGVTHAIDFIAATPTAAPWALRLRAH